MGLNTCLNISRSDTVECLEVEPLEEEDFDPDLEEEDGTSPRSSGFSNAKTTSSK